MKLAFHWRWIHLQWKANIRMSSSCLCDRDGVTCNYHLRGFACSGCRVYFIVLKLELQFSRRCSASTGNSFTHSFFYYYYYYYYYYFMSDFSDYPSQTISPCPPTPLYCNPVISGVATIKTNARKKQCSIFSFFRPFYKSIFLSMTWPEKEKQNLYFCVMFNR